MLKFNPLKSKTFWGALLAGAAFVLHNGVDPTTVAQAVGGVIATIGVRDAVEPGS